MFIQCCSECALTIHLCVQITTWQSVHRAHHWKQRLEAASIGKPASHARNKSLKWEGGESSWPHWQQQQQQREVQIVPLAPQRGSKGPVDVFGQSHPARATEIVTCRNCGRQVQAGMFAPHLEKCMGKGRAAGRAASKRIQAQTRLD